MDVESAQAADPTSLDVGNLLATAVEVAGLDDYGDQAFVEPMTKWVDSAIAEGYLNAVGRMSLRAQVIGWLVNRLRFEDDLKRHPEILDEDVSDPIVITGMMRTGTTKLQRVMAANPAVQRLEAWRLVNPAPFPGSNPAGPDPRIAVAREQFTAVAQFAPDFFAGHPMAAEEVDEEAFAMSMTFETIGNASLVRCPSYLDWWLAQPREGPYRFIRRLLQYLQWQDGGSRGRPWVLKSPCHLGNVDLLYATFPGATLVQCHRDPRVAIASAARLQQIFRSMGSDQVDPHENGEMWLDFWSGEMSRNLAQREQLTDEQVIIDVDFNDIRDDTIAVARRIYGRRDMELSSEAEARMTEWDRDNPQYKHGKFTYSLDDFELTGEVVDAKFADYLERFDITPTGS